MAIRAAIYLQTDRRGTMVTHDTPGIVVFLYKYVVCGQQDT